MRKRTLDNLLRRNGPLRWLVLAMVTLVALLLCTASLWLGPVTSVAVGGGGAAGGGAVRPVAPHLTRQQFDAAVTVLSGKLEHDGPVAAFGDARQRAATDASFARDCHPLMHALGHAAFDYYGSFDKAAAQQDELCDSGYVHGLIEAELVVVPDLRAAMASLCPAGAKQDLRLWQCYHGLGHGAMLSEDHDVARSLADCETLSGDFAVGACANGVFMERYLTVDHMGMPRTDVAASFDDCRLVKDMYKATCYGYAPTAYADLHGSDYRATYSWCLSAGGGAAVSPAESCVYGLGGQVMKDNAAATAVANDFCRSLAARYQAPCVRGAISLYINYKGSSAAAAPLCDKEFKDYRELCRYVVDYRKRQLSV